MRRIMQGRLNNVFVPATQSQQQTGTETTPYVSPANEHYHNAAAKGWAYVLMSGLTPILITGYNLNVSGTAAGIVNFNFTVAMASGTYVPVATVITATGVTNATPQITQGFGTTSFQVTVRNPGGGGGTTSTFTGMTVVVYGFISA